MTFDANNRRAMLAKVHVAKKQIGLSDEDYRQILEDFAGQKTARYCSDAQLHKILGHFKKLGFKPTSKGGAHATASDKPLTKKIFALWEDLGRTGALKNASQPALLAFVKRQTGVESPRWLTPAQANKVIEALKAMRARHEKKNEAAP